jgi:hypothetical protein
MIRPLSRPILAVVHARTARRIISGAVSLGLVVVMFGTAATPSLALRSSGAARVDTVADGPDAPAPLDVVVWPDTAATPADASTDPCAPPYDRPELACTLLAGTATTGSVSPTTGMSVYRYDAALPGTVIQAVVTQAPAALALFLVGPGDQVLSEADAGGEGRKSVAATVTAPGTHAIYIVAYPPSSGASYNLQLLAKPSVANTAVPLLPASVSAEMASHQCPQARVEADDTFFGHLMGLFMLPCADCIERETDGGGGGPASPPPSSPGSGNLRTIGQPLGGNPGEQPGDNTGTPGTQSPPAPSTSQPPSETPPEQPANTVATPPNQSPLTKFPPESSPHTPGSSTPGKEPAGSQPQGGQSAPVNPSSNASTSQARGEHTAPAPDGSSGPARSADAKRERVTSAAPAAVPPSQPGQTVGPGGPNGQLPDQLTPNEPASTASPC